MCDIIFTSGTTGAPKGAMLRHGASVRAYASWAEVVGLRHGDRYLLVYPLFHTAGLKSGLVASLLTGTTLLPHLVFDTPSVMATVQEERITMLPGPPAIYQTILNADLSEYDFSSLRLAVTGAAVVPVELVGADARAARPRVRGHRLRAHRDHRHREHVPPRRRPRDHRPHVGAADPRRRDEDRRRRRPRGAHR